MQLLTTPLPSYIYTLIAIAVVLLFGFRGYKRGLFKELFGFLSLFGAYIFAKPSASVMIALGFGAAMPDLFRGFAAEIVGSICVYILLELIFAFVFHKYKLGKLTKGKGEKQKHIRIGGALIGAVFGTIIVMAIAWYFVAFGDLAKVALIDNDQGNLMQLPAKITETHSKAFEDSFIGEIAEETDPTPEAISEGIEIFSTVMEEPEKIADVIEYDPIKEIIEDDVVLEFMQNEEIQDLAEEQDLMGILNHPATQALFDDPTIQEKMQEIDAEELKALLEGVSE